MQEAGSGLTQEGTGAAGHTKLRKADLDRGPHQVAWRALKENKAHGNGLCTQGRLQD